MKTVAFYNMKGGVGKTTAAVNFAYLAALEGQRTLLWDIDPQSSATFHFRIDAADGLKTKHLRQEKHDVSHLIKPTAYPNLDLLPANLKLRRIDIVLGNIKKGEKLLGKLIRHLPPGYAYLLMDCPPGMSVLIQALFQLVDTLIIPVIPTTLSFHAFERIREYLEKKRLTERLQIIPFFSMVDTRKSLHHQIMDQHGPSAGFCRTTIPTRSIVEQMGSHCAPLPSYSPDSTATEEYRQLWEEIKIRIEQ